MLRSFLYLGCLASLLLGITAQPALAIEHFITAQNGRLYDGSTEFRFLSWNIPNLLIVEDNFAWNAPHDWLLPDAFELQDALATVRQMGGTVVRTYSLPILRADESPEIPKYILGNGQYNETAFRTLDLALKIARDQGVRLIIPLINNWPWQGGREELAAWRHLPKEAFWTDPQLIQDFNTMTRQVLTRTNTLTGIRYCDDPTILCWETGNELRGPASWTQTVAHFIKSVDTNHLIMDGYDVKIRPEVLAMPEIDIVTTHHYPGGADKLSMAEAIRKQAAQVAGRKAFIVGEFGFVNSAEMIAAMQAITDSPAAGGLLWSLRFRNRTGGYYWHSEPDGANLYKAFHWPPSPVGNPYDETTLMHAVRRHAYAIRGQSVPVLPVPAAPRLLPFTDPGQIAWQGSVGAAFYEVERATATNQTWTVLATNVDEAFTQYRPVFCDENVLAGTWYYRVRAGNMSGWSPPSNLIGPLTVTQVTFVDEMADFSRLLTYSTCWKSVTQSSRVTKEDIHSLAGSSRTSLTYKVNGQPCRLKVYAFYEKNPGQVKLSVSTDNEHFTPVPVRAENAFHGQGDYGYWKPVLFTADTFPAGKFIKLEAVEPVQIGRLEIVQAAPAPVP